MSIELEKRSLNDTVGKPSKFKATFRGYYHGVQCVLSFEAETERDLSYIIPLIPGRELELEIKDPQATLDIFFQDKEAAKAIMAEKEKIVDEEAYRDERRRRAGAQA